MFRKNIRIEQLQKQEKNAVTNIIILINPVSFFMIYSKMSEIFVFFTYLYFNYLGAPGWEKFLGGKTSTVQFTSEEVQKLKKQHPPVPPPKPRTSASGLLESSFDEPPVPSELKNIGIHSKGPPS